MSTGKHNVVLSGLINPAGVVFVDLSRTVEPVSGTVLRKLHERMERANRANGHSY